MKQKNISHRAANCLSFARGGVAVTSVHCTRVLEKSVQLELREIAFAVGGTDRLRHVGSL